MNTPDHYTYLYLPLIYTVAWGMARMVIGRSSGIRTCLEVHAVERNSTIDGLRGLLALSVMGSHTMMTSEFLGSGTWGHPAMPLAAALGQVAVMLFFMITAFLFWDRLLNHGPKMDWTAFYVGRVFRLTPLYLLMVVILAAIALARAHGRLLEPISTFATHLGSWLTYTVRSEPNLNGMPQTWMVVAGVTWSLPYEWLFYFSLPLVGFVFTRAKSVVAVLVASVFVATFIWLRHFRPIDVNRLYPFFSGIVAAYWVRQPRLRRIAGSRLFGILAVIGLGFTLLAFPNPYAVLPLALITLFFLAATSDTSILRALRGMEARWLGEVSYGIYLFHAMGIWIVTRMILPRFFDFRTFSPWQDLAVILGTTCILVPIVSLFYLTVERPGIVYGRSIVKDFLAKPRAIDAPVVTRADEVTER
ncbi:MAG TPA: acyltransferase [Opitutaceae bacterium]|nr:acyltransferase [Opitutaceae bacterium]